MRGAELHVESEARLSKERNILMRLREIAGTRSVNRVPT